MIYPDYKISEWAADCGIYPYNPECVNPASMDLCIDDVWIDTNTGEQCRSSQITLYPPSELRELWYRISKFLGKPFGYIPKHKPTGILATTLEYVHMLPNMAGDVKLKSTLARSGLDHALAGWIDPGFKGQITLELHAHRKVTLHAGQRICQLIIHGMEPPREAYRGKYQNQFGPQGAKEDYG